MCAAVNVADVVRERHNIFRIAVIVLQGHITGQPGFRVIFRKTHHRRNRIFPLVKIFHKCPDAVFVMVHIFLLNTVVLKGDMRSGV